MEDQLIRTVWTKELERIATQYPFSMFTVAYMKFNFNLTDYGVEQVIIKAIERGESLDLGIINKEIYDSH